MLDMDRGYLLMYIMVDNGVLDVGPRLSSDLYNDG